MMGSKMRELARKRRRGQRGATAIEFAIIAPVMLALIFTIVEVGYYYFTVTTIDSAAAKAARLIRTGQAMRLNMTKNEFYAEICDVTKHIGDCTSRMTVEVERYNTFNQLSNDSDPMVCADEETSLINAIPYNIGAENDIIRVRVCYLHGVLNPGVGVKLKRNSEGNVRLVSAIIHQNEPFPTADED